MDRAFDQVRCLIVGYGSIGRRHAKILQKLGGEVSVATSQTDVPYDTLPALEHTSANLARFDYVVIANQTSQHWSSYATLLEAGFKGIVVLEKPVFHRHLRPDEPEGVATYVGYNLRFHPALQELRRRLADRPALSARIYCGSYLPDWRPDRDYRTVESSSSETVGGVARELSHELDYTRWLLGDIELEFARSEHVSGLDMPADDILLLCGQTDRCAALSLELNFFDRIGRREIQINCEHGSYGVDLFQHRFQHNQEVIEYELESDTTYIDMHRALITGQTDSACTLQEGLAVMALIEQLPAGKAARA